MAQRLSADIQMMLFNPSKSSRSEFFHRTKESIGFREWLEYQSQSPNRHFDTEES